MPLSVPTDLPNVASPGDPKRRLPFSSRAWPDAAHPASERGPLPLTLQPSVTRCRSREIQSAVTFTKTTNVATQLELAVLLWTSTNLRLLDSTIP